MRVLGENTRTRQYKKIPCRARLHKHTRSIQRTIDNNIHRADHHHNAQSLHATTTHLHVLSTLQHNIRAEAQAGAKQHPNP